MSTIQQFYTDQTIFLTGATGFLGKLILEKLLRTCDVKKIYILIRSKKNKNETERLQQLLQQPCFQKVKAVRPDFSKKIFLINGDCSLPNLGLSEEDQTILKNEVTCVIHSAAIVKFDRDLRTTTYTNLRSVRDLIHLAREMSKLKRFVYVSTAFSHCPRKYIAEEFYDLGIDPEEFIEVVEGFDDRMLNILTPCFLKAWPNTYVYSKALAESLLSRAEAIPVTIVRPSIVASTSEEPVPGWIDNFQGLVGVVIGVSLGVLRTLHVNPRLRTSIVPADYVVNNILAAACYSSPGRTIYNCTGSEENAITWGQVVDGLMEFSFKYPLSSTLWYYGVVLTPSFSVHKIRVFFSHTLYAYFVDFLLMAMGKRRIAVKKYNKIDKLINSLSYFTLRSWDFSTKNNERLWERMSEEDRKMFNFDMKNFSWRNYYENCVIGGRLYLMKDPLSTVPRAKIRIFLLALVHYGLIFIIFCLFFTIVYKGIRYWFE